MAEYRVHVLCCLGALLLSGCSKDDSQPAPQAASKQTSGHSRQYAPIPSDLLTAPASRPALEAFLAVDEALVNQDIAQAIKVHQDMMSKQPDAKACHIAAALQLVQAILSKTPSEVKTAAALLEAQRATVSSPSIPSRLRSHWSWWMLAVQLRGAQAAIVGGGTAYESLYKEVADLVSHLEPHPLFAEHILAATDSMRTAVDPTGSEAVERIEKILVHLQCQLPEASQIAPLQLQRVRLLQGAQKYAEALYETRTLLALCSQDAPAWISARRELETILAGSQRGNDLKAWTELQRWGPGGPDGRVGTSDDLADPLAACRRTNADLDDYLAVLTSKVATAPVRVSDLVRIGYIRILVGQPRQALEHFRKITESDAQPSDAETRAVLLGLAGARAGADGYTGNSLASLADIVDSKTSAPVWRNAAAEMICQQIGIVRHLITNQQPDVALGWCRSLAEDPRLTDTLPSIMQAALDACKALGTEGASAQMSLFCQFGMTLSQPRARICQTRLAAQEIYSTGDPSKALEEIASLPDETQSVSYDPALHLLQVGCLLRLSRVDEALRRTQSLLARLDLDADLAAKGRLTLAAIYLQQAKPLAARQVLEELMEESPETEYATRAQEILSRI